MFPLRLPYYSALFQVISGLLITTCCVVVFAAIAEHDLQEAHSDLLHALDQLTDLSEIHTVASHALSSLPSHTRWTPAAVGIAMALLFAALASYLGWLLSCQLRDTAAVIIYNSKEDAWGFIRHDPPGRVWVEELRILHLARDLHAQRIVELLQGFGPEEEEMLAGRRKGKACVFEEGASVCSNRTQEMSYSCILSPAARPPQSPQERDVSFRPQTPSTSSPAPMLLGISPSVAPATTPRLGLEDSDVLGRSFLRGNHGTSVAAAIAGMGSGSLSHTSMLAHAVVPMWKEGTASFLCIRTKMGGSDDVLTHDEAEKHMVCIDEVRSLARTYGAKLEWDGSDDILLCWTGGDSLVPRRVLECSKAVSATLTTRGTKWNVGLVRGKAMVASKGSRPVTILSNARAQARALASFAMASDTPIIALSPMFGTVEELQGHGFFEMADVDWDAEKAMCVLMAFCPEAHSCRTLNILLPSIRQGNWQGARAIIDTTGTALGGLREWYRTFLAEAEEGNIAPYLTVETTAIHTVVQQRAIPLHHAVSMQSGAGQSVPGTKISTVASCTFAEMIRARVGSKRSSGDMIEDVIPGRRVSTEYSRTPEESLERFAAVFGRHVSENLVHTRSGRWCRRSTADVFNGHDCVAWMCHEFGIDQETAVGLGEQLRSRGLFYAVSGATVFVNTRKALYRFRENILHATLDLSPDAAASEFRSGTADDGRRESAPYNLAMLLQDIEDEDERKAGRGVSRKRTYARVRRRLVVRRSEEQETEDYRKMRIQLQQDIWNLAKMGALVLNCINIPLHVGFDLPFAVWLAVVQWFFDVLVYWMSIIIRLRAHKEGHYLNYVRSPEFVVAVLGCFPIEVVAMAWDTSFIWNPMFRINRLVNLMAFNHLFTEISGRFLKGASPIRIQAVKLLVLCIFLLHLVAGLLHFVIDASGLDGRGSSGRYFNIEGFQHKSVRERYFICVDWAMRALSGYGCRWPQTDAQTLVVGVCQIAGVAVWATVIAYVAVLLESANPSQKKYENLVEELRGYLREKELPSTFRKEVLGYVRFLWESTRMYHVGQYDFLLDQSVSATDMDSITWTLPDDLRSPFAFHLNEHVLDAIPLVGSESNDMFVADVVSKLQMKAYTPGAVIIEKSSAGDVFYLLTKGKVAVYDGQGPEQEQEEGSFFGELPLLFGLPSPFRVVAKTYVIVYTLSYQAFQWAVHNYPHCLQRVLEIADRRFAEYCGSATLTRRASTLSLDSMPLRRPSGAIRPEDRTYSDDPRPGTASSGCRSPPIPVSCLMSPLMMSPRRMSLSDSRRGSLTFNPLRRPSLSARLGSPYHRVTASKRVSIVGEPSCSLSPVPSPPSAPPEAKPSFISTTGLNAVLENDNEDATMTSSQALDDDSLSTSVVLNSVPRPARDRVED